MNPKNEFVTIFPEGSEPVSRQEADDILLNPSNCATFGLDMLVGLIDLMEDDIHPDDVDRILKKANSKEIVPEDVDIYLYTVGQCYERLKYSKDIPAVERANNVLRGVLVSLSETHTETLFNDEEPQGELFYHLVEQSLLADKDHYPEQSILFLEKILLAGGYGEMRTWMEHGELRDELPDFVETIKKHPFFKKSVIDLSLPREYNIQDFGRRFLTHFSGVSEELSGEIIQACSQRLINLEEGADTFGHFANRLACIDGNLTEIGSEAAEDLYKKFGILNYDSYPRHVIHRMSRLARGDETLLRHLQEGEVTLVLTDGKELGYSAEDGLLRDHFGIETACPGGRILYAEAHDVQNIYRIIMNIARSGGDKYDIRPSNFVFSAHGNPGVLSMAGEKVYADKIGNSQNVAITAAKGLRGIVERYMRPGKESDMKYIVAASCYSAEANVNGSIIGAIAEHLPDDAVAQGPTIAGNVSYDRCNSELRFGNGVNLPLNRGIRGFDSTTTHMVYPDGATEARRAIALN